ncbi:hypothetical protein [Rehaibacterium terrae]|jgi:hypothetical protein|uniref:DUF560 domain-containing protein n=1 Tax=Rehaibacterium terrae TaxID=1341696 RepID=A0A7W7Y1H0_9GAMM|nr:hypothetical protein [Rehaibacterium terrae]MBB5016361.1 hypothetical protein [Rehaibacterium terrae]
MTRPRHLFRLPLLLPLAAAAQSGPALQAHYRDLSGTAFGDARLHGREHGLRLRTGELTLGGGRFVPALDYAYTRYEYTGLPSRNRDLHRLALDLAWTRHDAGVLHVALTPVVATSSNVFKDLFARGSGRDLDLHARLWLAQPPAADGIGWRAGLFRDDAFGRPRVYPQVSALWRRDDVRAELGWPTARIDWAPAARWAIGARLAPAGRRWHVVSDERDGARFHYRQEAWRAALMADWMPAARWRLSLQGGVEFERRHRFEDDTGAPVDRRPGDARFVELALRYGLD